MLVEVTGAGKKDVGTAAFGCPAKRSEAISAPIENPVIPTCERSETGGICYANATET
jgi:hypothetical protein